MRLKNNSEVCSRRDPSNTNIKKIRRPLLCILSGENTNTTKEFSLVVFFYWKRFYERLPPGGSWRRRRLRESAIQRKLRKLKVTRAPSVTLRVPPSSRRKAYVRAVSLLIVGSGICPIMRGIHALCLPRTRASGKQKMNIKVSAFCQDKFTTVCYNDITNIQLNV